MCEDTALGSVREETLNPCTRQTKHLAFPEPSEISQKYFNYGFFLEGSEWIL